jgi:uncharacterized integral membrane protein
VYEGNEASPDAAGDERGSGVSPTLIAFIVLGVLAIIFVLQNGTSAQIDYLGLNFEAPLWVILAITIAVGVVLDRLFSLWWRRRKRRS